MADENLKRVTAKIFAGEAEANVVGQFGSALNGTKVNTTDIDEIQGLSAYTIGWSSAVLTDRNYPTMEEMNGAMKVMSYQTAYTMQKGVAEWDKNTVYYCGDICKGVGVGVLYVSRLDENKGNDVDDSTCWAEYSASTMSLPATNYISEMGGDVTYSGNTINLPAMTLYAPNGRNSDNSLKSTVVSTSAKSFDLTGSGTYNLFYNADEHNLLLAANYTKRTDTEPEIKLTNDVWYSHKNIMYYISTSYPNYNITAGDVDVNSDGVVSGLGTITISAEWDVSKTPVFHFGITTGDDITTEQTLFSIPFADAVIVDGNLAATVYSYSYAVSYYPIIYNGSYDGLQSLDNENSVLKYVLGENTYYSATVVTEGDKLYTDEDLTTVYGVVKSITDDTIVVQSMETSTGYVSVKGTDTVDSDVVIYTDVDLTDKADTSDGTNATYTGDIEKSKAGVESYKVEANTTYTCSFAYVAGTGYELVLNETGTILISSREPYNSASDITLGGELGFSGTFDLANTYIDDVWTWNGLYTGAPQWVKATLVELGYVILYADQITDLHIHTPIELVKFSDLEDYANINMTNVTELGKTNLRLIAGRVTYDTINETYAVDIPDAVDTSHFIRNAVYMLEDTGEIKRDGILEDLETKTIIENSRYQVIYL